MAKTKQVIVLRKDLGMRLGKAVAQGSHAAMKVFFDKMKIMLGSDEDNATFYTITGNITDAMVEWIQGSYAKIVVWCKDESELFQLKHISDVSGIANALILDEGRTEFKEICPDCNGLGVHVSALGAPLVDSLSCMKCNGTGKVGKPTYTALAIGPDYADRIDPITKDLPLA